MTDPDPYTTSEQLNWIAEQLESLPTSLPEVTTPEQRLDATRRASLRAALNLQHAILDFMEATLP